MVGTGPVFWVHLVYANLMILVATVLFVASMVRLSGTYRRMALVLVSAALLPWVFNLLHNFEVGWFATIDLTPFAFIVTGGVLVWGVFRERLVRLSPLARGRDRREHERRGLRPRRLRSGHRREPGGHPAAPGLAPAAGRALPGRRRSRRTAPPRGRWAGRTPGLPAGLGRAPTSAARRRRAGADLRGTPRAAHRPARPARRAPGHPARRHRADPGRGDAGAAALASGPGSRPRCSRAWCPASCPASPGRRWWAATSRRVTGTRSVATSSTSSRSATTSGASCSGTSAARVPRRPR